MYLTGIFVYIPSYVGQKLLIIRVLKKIEMRRKDFGDFITISYYTFITK